MSRLEALNLMTTAEVADLTGFSRAFIYREIAAGRLSAFRIRKAIRISQSDLQDYLERRHQVAKDTSGAKRKHF